MPGIRDRFWKKRQQGGGRAAALLYAIWLNVQYYLLFRRSLGEPARTLYEDRRLYSGGSESSLSVRQPPQMLADALAAYDVISFDVFDTLLFRPLAAPADLFDLVGMTLRYPGFRALRIQAEKQARQSRQAHSGYAEVTLEEIWAELSRVSGIPADEGIRAEWTWERRCCTANAYMLAVVRALRAKGKTLCIVSDMYLGRERIRALLAPSQRILFRGTKACPKAAAVCMRGCAVPLVRSTHLRMSGITLMRIRSRRRHRELSHSAARMCSMPAGDTGRRICPRLPAVYTPAWSMRICTADWRCIRGNTNTALCTAVCL